MVETESQTNEDMTPKQKESIAATHAPEATNTTSVEPAKNDGSMQIKPESTMSDQQEVTTTAHDETVQKKKVDEGVEKTETIHIDQE